MTSYGKISQNFKKTNSLKSRSQTVSKNSITPEYFYKVQVQYKTYIKDRGKTIHPYPHIADSLNQYDFRI